MATIVDSRVLTKTGSQKTTMEISLQVDRGLCVVKFVKMAMQIASLHLCGCMYVCVCIYKDVMFVCM